MAANPFAEFAAPQENPFAQFAVAPQPTEMPAPRQPTSALTQFGRSVASLADVTLGGIIPGAAQYLMPPMLRAAGRSPEQATASTQALVGAVDRPFGKAFGVAETPEYQQEAGRQVMDFIGQNFQKGAKFISDKTGLPVSDVENMMASLTIAAPKIAPPVVRAVKEVTAPVIQQVKTGAQLPFEPMLQAKRERLSAESYAKGPQLDAAAEAQRLKLVLNPTDIENSISARAYSAAAGPRGPEALAAANRPRVNEIAKNELGLDPTTPLTSAAPFKQARANLAAPYEDIKKLPIQQADAAMVQRLEAIRSDLEIIGAKEYAPAISKIVDDAISKTQTGLTGETLLKNISVLRERAKKTYNNKSATTEAIDIADTNLKIASELESMIDGSIANPKLLEQYRDARQKMARTYAYESATDFNTGMVDVSKLARLTAKDNALTGDIASLGKIAGNFPEVFTTEPTSKFFSAPRLTRSGVPGGAGALIGSQFGLTGSILGGLAGGAIGEFGGAMAANRLASPAYQAGLKLQDFRIPVNQMAAAAAPTLESTAVLNEKLNSVQIQTARLEDDLRRASDAGDKQFITAQLNRLNQYADQLQQNIKQAAVTEPQNFLIVPPAAPLPAIPRLGYDPNVPVQGQPGAFDIMRARERDLSMRQGAQAEAQQAAAEAAARRPTSGGSVLEFDPITGTYKVGGAGIKGATPEVFMSDTGRNLNTASQKVAAGQNFALSAAEKVAWEKTKVDLAVAAPELKGLSDKAIASKIMDREWADGAITKARQQAQAFDEIATRATTDQARRAAAMKREQMLDVLNTLEDQLRAPRPTSLGGQGPKTRAAIRNKLVPQDNQNSLAP
jgi:hypothetical protein